jgi:tRNA threonylcarbamoyladenosine biosynthesis protein TsaE
MHSLSYLGARLADTSRLASSIADHLRPGDAVLLSGKLGAGKTAFVQAVADSLGFGGHATSPTFTLANFYETPRLTMLHVDVYRLDDLSAFRDLGLDEYYDDCLTIVEWGDRVAEDFEDPLRIEILFSPSSEGNREFRLSADGPRWEGTFNDLRRSDLTLVNPS